MYCLLNNRPCLQVRVNLFEPIISVFVANGEKYNLLNSVILELFNFIYINSIRNLIDYFMATQYHRVEDVDYDKTFQLLKTKWDQMHDASTETGVASDQLNASRLQKDPRALDRGTHNFPIFISFILILLLVFHRLDMFWWEKIGKLAKIIGFYVRCCIVQSIPVDSRWVHFKFLLITIDKIIVISKQLVVALELDSLEDFTSSILA